MKQINYDELKYKLDLDERADFKFRERRHAEWKENYQLYRDRVNINRLTQRQSVNAPLIKGLVKTVLANADEKPSIEFEDRANDKDKDIVMNELWKDFTEKDKFELKDIVDKKQVLLYGKSWKHFNIVDGRVTIEIKDVMDVLIDRFADPSDIETADHISIHGIFRTLDQLQADETYDQKAISRLKTKYAGQLGIKTVHEATTITHDSNERLELMGVDDINDPVLGNTVVQLKLHYKKIWDDEDEKQHIHVIVMCDDEILMAKPLMELLGVDFYPLVTWSDDPERLDHYPDGLADIARTPNKILNSWISSLVENRTLRNMNMHIFDSGIEGFNPQTFQPAPFGWYGMPVPEGKTLNDIYKTLEVPDLSESLDEMAYIEKITQTAVAVSSTVQGDVQQSKVTLGEVELAMGAAKERLSSFAKFYNLALKETAEKWAKIMNANWDKLESVELFKKAHTGDYFGKVITYKDWKTEKGYECRVVSSAEQQQKSIETLQKNQAVAAQFPNNPIVRRISGKKLLEFADYNPDEIKEVMEFEEQTMGGMQDPLGMPPEAQNAPVSDVLPQDVPLIPEPNAPTIIG